jgi:HSP20 family protein
MQVRDPTLWMWGEALELLERADRIHRQFFQLGAHRLEQPTWEPPVDIFETERQFVIVVALPGVAADKLIISLDGPMLVVHGQRRLPDLGHSALIHRIELPYGRFERRIELPTSQLALGERALADGCLVMTLDKQGAGP